MASEPSPVVAPVEPEPVTLPAVEPSGFAPHRVIARSFALMGRHGIAFLALIAAAALPERFVYHLIESNLLSPILTLLGCLGLYAAVFHIATGDLRGEPVNFAGAIRAAKAMPVSAYIAIAITFLAVWFLAILPASAADRALAAPVAILEGKGWRDARARSAALIAPCRARVRLLLLLLAGLALSRAVAMLPFWGLADEALPSVVFGDWLFPQLLTVVTATAGAALYRELGPDAA